MNNNFIIARINYDNNELDNIAKLYTVCFQRPKDINFLKWKYLDNPAGEALCLVAKHNQDIAGSCVMIPEKFYIFGEKIKIYKCCDLMVNPHYRRQGVSTKLIFSLSEHLKESAPLFLYTLCGKNATPSFLKNKWLKLDDVHYYFKHKSQVKVGLFFNNIKKLYDRGILRQINSVSELCKNYKCISAGHKIHIVKDEEYFAWRFGNPLFEYRTIGYYDKEVLKGYIIYNAGINNDAYIVDLEVNDNDPEITKTLLRSVEFAALNSNRRLIIALAIKDSTFQIAVNKNNYMRNPLSRGPLASIMDFNILIDKRYSNKVLDKSNWNIYPLSYDDI